jgi:hypothetical protein
MKIALAFVKCLLLNVLGLILTLAGLLAVWLALPFAKADEQTRAPFTQYPILGDWVLVRLPFWARPWDNAFDGVMGDKRGWFANWCVEQGWEWPSRLGFWWWAAIRNPSNYFSRNVCGIDVSQFLIGRIAGQDVVEADAGHPGWQLLIAQDARGRVYPRFFAEIPWSFAPDHLFLVDVGWKIKLSHNDLAPDAALSEKIKGTVLTISPWKAM